MFLRNSDKITELAKCDIHGTQSVFSIPRLARIRLDVLRPEGLYQHIAGMLWDAGAAGKNLPCSKPLFLGTKPVNLAA